MQAIEEFIRGLPADRQTAVRALRQTMLQHLPDGYEETFASGMINYVVPHSIFPAGYHCNPKQPLGFAAIANTKGHVALHLMALYMNPKAIDALEADFQAAGKKLVMGKACLRFKKLDDMALDAIGRAIARLPVDTYIGIYQNSLAARR